MVDSQLPGTGHKMNLWISKATDSTNLNLRAESSGPEGSLFSAPLSLSLPLVSPSLFTEAQSRALNEDECEESICGIFLPSGRGSSLHLN